jgi:peptidoglycan/LPS O-acetylase OafA/YrhL
MKLRTSINKPIQNIMSDNKNLTDFLKGFAILSVLLNHYINIYLSNSFNGMANGFIAMFFILSGYGLFYSFEKQGKLTKSGLFRYYLKRCLRIYPLFWVSLLIVAYSRNDWGIMSSFILPDVKILVIYWFLNALIQCYLVAPLLFELIKKLKPGTFLILVFCLFAMFNIVSHFSGYTSEAFNLKYRNLAGGHLFLFSMGMMLPWFIKKEPAVLSSKRTALLGLILFLLLTYATRQIDFIFKNVGILLSPVFLLAVLFFCYSVLTGKLSVSSGILSRLLIFMGIYSYSLYLFHLDYFRFLSQMGFIKKELVPGHFFTIGFFPVFFLMCMLVEKLINRITGIILEKTDDR